MKKRSGFILLSPLILLLMLSSSPLVLAKVYPVEKFGARANKSTDNTQAIQRAIDKCHREGGGTVALTQGLYLSGTLQLKSHVSLQISRSSTLKAIEDSSAFRRMRSSLISRMDVVPWKAFIHADGQEDIHLFGGGVIDGSGDAACFTDGIENSPARPYGLHFINCTNISVQDLSLRSSAFWMQRYFNCKSVRLINLNVYNHANKNKDGMDIDSSEDVLVSGCIIDPSDDAICIKSEGENPARNIVVTDCIVATHASAIKLGTGSVGGV